MWTTILAGALLAAAPVPQGDTTLAVDPHARLRMEDARGDVTIRTWDRPEMRVQVTDAQDARLRVSAGATTVSVALEPERYGGTARPSGDIELTIPATMSISVGTQSGDVHIDGTTGEVSVQTVRGDVSVRGGTGVVQLRSVQGDITLQGARARVEVHAVSGDLLLQDVVGDVVAETMNGDVHMQRLDAGSVDVRTVGGDVQYQGTVRDAGRYSVTTHGGDITFVLPQNAGAVIRVTTFNGEFQADVPVQLTEQTRGNTSSFTVGSGSARVELESFSGDIHLARTGAEAGR